MRLLFITAVPLDVNSSQSICNNAIVKGFQEAGWEVEVATSDLPGDSASHDSSLSAGQDVRTYHFGLGLYRYFYARKRVDQSSAVSGKGVPAAERIKTLAKAMLLTVVTDPFAFWATNAKRWKLGSRYDLVLSASDPVSSHSFAARLISRNRANCGKWVQVWGDPLFHDVSRRSNPFRLRLKITEQTLLFRADSVIYLNQLTAELQKQTYPRLAGRIAWMHCPWLSASQYPEGEKGLFGYFGSFPLTYRDIRPLFQAFSMSELVHCRLVVAGDGDAPQPCPPNILIHGRMGYGEVREMESHCCALIVLANSHGAQIPAKAFYYAGTNKPVLFILDGDRQALLKTFRPYGRYVFCDNTAESIKDGLKNILGMGGGVFCKAVEDFSPSACVQSILQNVVTAE